MRTEKAFDLLVWLCIAAVGIIAAYVCFGVLTSQADGKFQQYSVGGAIAGALISWGVLTSVYLQLRGSSGELQDLRKRAEELQSKLIRGAPRPQGFETEVDEKQRIVLARPENWEPKGGTIFDLELPENKMSSNDMFPARFRCYFVPIEKDSKQTRAEFHAAEIALLKNAGRYVQSYSHEVVRLGGEAGEVESIKVIANQVVRTVIRKSPDTGRCERDWNLISWPEFVGDIDNVYPRPVIVGHPVVLSVYGTGFRKGTICYVNRNKRETHVIDNWQARVKLIDDDVANPGVLELVIENPEAKGKHSEAHLLMVAEAHSAPSPIGPTSAAGNAEISPAPPAPAPPENAAPDPTQKTPLPTPDTAPKPEEPRVVYQEVVRMRVACHHEQLAKIYYFEFWDDAEDFLASSAVFNRIVASTRFLN